MKKILFVLAAILTSSCSSDNTRQEPTLVYRGFDDQGCNYYNGVCNRAPRKFVVQNTEDQETLAYQQQASAPVVKSGEHKHCSAVMFGDPVPAPKVISSGPKVIRQAPQVQYAQQPVQYVAAAQPVQYVQRPVQYVQANSVIAPAQNICATGNSGCQPSITQTREPIEVLFKKTTTTTVYEPQSSQEVSYEKEPYVGQVSYTQAVEAAPTIIQVPTLTVPAPTVYNVPNPTVVRVPTPTVYNVPAPTVFNIPTQPVAQRIVRRTMPEAQMSSEIIMDSSEIK